MAATCAACLQPILRMDQCTISGSEVFHRRCVANIEDSIGNRRQRQIHELTQALEQSGRAVRQIERSAQQASRAAVSTAEQLTVALARAETALARATAESAVRRREHEQEVAALRAERDIARAEAAIAAAPRIATPADNPDSPDDATMRFSLLELDRQ